MGQETDVLLGERERGRKMTKENWRKVNDEPEDNQSCHIRGSSDMMRLNITYKREAKGWLDFFGTPEGGTFYSAKAGVIAWIPAEEIPDPPDAWFDEAENHSE